MPARLAAAWRDPSPLTARLMLFTAACLWSVGGLLIKEIDTGALNIVFFRCFFSALLLAPFLRGRRFPTRPDTIVSIIIFALLLVLFVAATKETTAANAIFLQYTAPIWVVVFAPVLIGEHLRRSDAIPLAICLGGIAVLFAGNWSSGDAAGLIMGTASGLFFGLYFVWLRRMRYADPVAITAVSCAGVALILLPVPFFSDLSLESLGLLAVMATFQFAIPYVLFARGIAYVSGTEASLIALIEPVLNPIWVALFYGEDPSKATIIGGAVILFGLGLRYTVFRPPAEEAPLEPAAEAGGGPLFSGPQG
ncbi:MAG: DMT family transporter [Dehalococcoidia bacterium]